MRNDEFYYDALSEQAGIDNVFHNLQAKQLRTKLSELKIDVPLNEVMRWGKEEADTAFEWADKAISNLLPSATSLSNTENANLIYYQNELPDYLVQYDKNVNSKKKDDKYKIKV